MSFHGIGQLEQYRCPLARKDIMGEIRTTYNKGSAELLEPDDLTALTQLAVSSLKEHGGHIAKFESDQAGLEQFVQKSVSFFEYCNEINASLEPQQRLIPDIESWCCFLGITRQTLMKYTKRNQQWSDAIEMIKENIAMAKKQLGLRNRIPQMVLAFDLVNNHAYRNTTEFRITAEPKQETETPRISMAELTAISEMPEMPQ